MAPAPADAQVLMRHLAEWRFGGEQFSNNTAVAFPGMPDGDPIYQKTFNLPPDQVEIRMATSNPNTPVFVERSHYYIDSVDLKLCNQADPVPGGSTGDPTEEEHLLGNADSGR